MFTDDGRTTDGRTDDGLCKMYRRSGTTYRTSNNDNDMDKSAKNWAINSPDCLDNTNKTSDKFLKQLTFLFNGIFNFKSIN